MLNPISYCFYVLPSVYISAEKNLQLFIRKKEENPMGEAVHPIPCDNKFFKSVPWDGMRWDCPIPLGALVPIDPQVLYYRGTHRSSSPILQEYLQFLKSYIIGVPVGPQVLYYRGTHRPQVLYSNGTHRSSSPISQGYPQVLRFYVIAYNIGLDDLQVPYNIGLDDLQVLL